MDFSMPSLVFQQLNPPHHLPTSLLPGLPSVHLDSGDKHELHHCNSMQLWPLQKVNMESIPTSLMYQQENKG